MSGAGAVLGAGVVLTGNTPVIDPRGEETVEYRGRVPAGRDRRPRLATDAPSRLGTTACPAV